MIFTTEIVIALNEITSGIISAQKSGSWKMLHFSRLCPFSFFKFISHIPSHSNRKVSLPFGVTKV